MLAGGLVVRKGQKVVGSKHTTRCTAKVPLLSPRTAPSVLHHLVHGLNEEKQFHTVCYGVITCDYTGPLYLEMILSAVPN